MTDVEEQSTSEGIFTEELKKAEGLSLGGLKEFIVHIDKTLSNWINFRGQIIEIYNKKYQQHMIDVRKN